MNKISLVKKTIGKNGKYYYYESLSSVENAKDVYWYKTDVTFFKHLINSYKKNAINIEYDEKGEIAYMEYSENEKQYSENIISNDNPKKEAKGCLQSLFFTSIFLIIVLSIITF